MPNLSKKISELPAAGALSGDEEIPIARNGANAKATIAQVAALARNISTIEPSDSELSPGEARFWLDLTSDTLFTKAKRLDGTIMIGEHALS